jgi:hypothetical protein
MILFSPLVWPLATLMIALIFRRDLGQAMGRIGQVKYRDLELTFRENLHQAEQLARSIPSTDKGSVVLEVARDEPELLTGTLLVAPSMSVLALKPAESSEFLAGSCPHETIEAAWGVLARVSKRKRGWASSNPEIARLVDLLRTLRERAVRPDAPPPSPEDARRFVDLTRQVASRIEELG